MFTQRVTLTQQGPRMVSATQLHELGSIAETADGRTYRYTGNGAVALAAGIVTVTPALVANHTNIAVAAAAAVGTRTVSVTVGATAVTTGQYDGGYLTVIDVAGVGATYRIAGTPTISSSGTGSIVLIDPIMTALTTSSKVSLVPNPWSSNIVHPGSSGAFFCAGNTNVAVTASSYYWSQTGGMASCLNDATLVPKGNGAILSSATAGALTAEVAASVTQRIAVAPEATVAAKYYPVYFILDK